ncbi:MAG: hypothetical protein AAF570_03725, partial [Bacteroidota bacterium]
PEEKIKFLVNFGKDAPGEWGDDDHSNVFFIALPTDHDKPFYVRIYDPDTGGAHDEAKGEFNTSTRFSVYGGNGAFTHPDARSTDPKGNYLSGNVIHTKRFAGDAKYDDKWYSLGPIHPQEGERCEVNGQGKIVFKLVAEGVLGDDGNLFNYYISSYPDRNMSVEGVETFTFEYTFRMQQGLSHIYPFVDESVLRVRQHNYDFDGDGYLRIVSVAKKSEMATMSTDGEWGISVHEIQDEERGMCLDFQVVSLVQRRNNNVVFSIFNQYGEALPFMNAPIGIENIRNKIRTLKK